MSKNLVAHIAATPSWITSSACSSDWLVKVRFEQRANHSAYLDFASWSYFSGDHNGTSARIRRRQDVFRQDVLSPATPLEETDCFVRLVEIIGQHSIGECAVEDVVTQFADGDYSTGAFVL